jgi:hypothetical protein
MIQLWSGLAAAQRKKKKQGTGPSSTTSGRTAINTRRAAARPPAVCNALQVGRGQARAPREHVLAVVGLPSFLD